MICAVIPAAGQGSRMNSSVNKQFIDLCGVPVIVRTLRAFEESPLIDSIVAVTRDSEREELKLLCIKYNITKLMGIAHGGDTRQDSVRNALEFLANIQVDPENCYVLIHDGARPFVYEDIIQRSIEAVRKYKACGVGVPVKDTIKNVSTDLKILETLPRENLWAIQTPQSFHFPLISKLHQKAFDDRLQFTDDTSLAEHYGESAYMVQGDYQNIKITTPEDLLYGEMILNKGKA